MKHMGRMLVVAAWIGTAVSMTALAAPEAVDQVAGSSTLDYSLATGSPAYQRWAVFIRQEASETLPQLFKGIGQITIEIHTVTPKSAVTATSPVPDTAVTPTALPAVGSPGQIITVANSSSAGSQKWTYEWNADSHRWVRTAYAGCLTAGCAVSMHAG